MENYISTNDEKIYYEEESELLSVKEMIALVQKDAFTHSLSDTARHMEMSPSAVTNAISRGSVPFRGIFKFSQYTGVGMEYYLTGKNPLKKYLEAETEYQKELIELRKELELIKKERDRLLLAISGNYNNGSE